MEREAPPPVLARPKSDVVVPSDLDPPEVLEVEDAFYPKTTARRLPLFRPPLEAVPTRRKRATGFADVHAPRRHLDQAKPLEPGSRYLFWFEVGEVVGSIEDAPTPVPAAVPDEAILVVRLFAFRDELELEDEAHRGAVRLKKDGTAEVVERAATVSDDHELHERRLFFRLRTPDRPGEFRLRCSLYRGVTLVQSRLVTAAVGEAQRVGRDALRSSLDYALTRRIAPSAVPNIPEHRLSLQVNGSNGTHEFRFVGRDGDQEFDASPTIEATELQTLVEASRGALRKVAWGNEELAGGVPYLYAGGGDDERLRRDLANLALHGYRLYDGIVDDLSEGQTARLERCMRRPGAVQIATSRWSMYVPAGGIYDHPIDDGELDDRPLHSL